VPSYTRTTAAKRTSQERFDPRALYDKLFSWYGPSGWWPGDSPLEIAVGAVLTQNTAWTNVEKAIANLKAAGMLDIHRIHAADTNQLASLIRPSGYYNIKTKRLKNLITLIMDSFSGEPEAFFAQDLDRLRCILLGVNGIGKETADSICLYAADKEIFVVDAYTKRILLRHSIIEPGWDYDDVQQLFEKSLPNRLDMYKDLHAYLVFIGKEYCRARNPQCEACPLNGWISPQRISP
jgi:endonuclease-3 related protein